MIYRPFKLYRGDEYSSQLDSLPQYRVSLTNMSSKTDPCNSCLKLINLFPKFGGKIVSCVSLLQKYGKAIECLNPQ